MVLPTLFKYGHRSWEPHSELTFYKAFERDLRSAKFKVLIESPFITTKRFISIWPMIEELLNRGVKVTVNTRNPKEHGGIYVDQATNVISVLQAAGVHVLYTTRLHRKVAVIDGEVFWQGSLNILSHTDSCEVMMRQRGKANAKKFLKFLGIYD